MRYVFITGMFRSGTTMIARMLNTHSQVACASDPLRPLLNSYRYAIADADYKSTHSRFDPLDDYFMSGSDLLKKILDADFDIPMEEKHDELFKSVRQRATQFSRLWATSLDPRRRFATYKDFMDYALDHINTVYGNDRDIYITAFKEVWTNEFVPAFLRSYPDSKAIILVRDPRAVVSSNIASGGKYPVFFLSRQWRKLSFLANLLVREHPRNIYVIRYEDLVENPELEIKKLTDFMEVPFEEELLDISNYLDGDNKHWKQNTHYDYETKMTINTDSLHRWRNALQDPELLLIELICRDWMEYFGYKCLYNIDFLIKRQFNEFSRWPTSELAEWVRPYSFDENDNFFSAEVLKEKMRLWSVYTNNQLTYDDKFILQIRGEE